MRPCNFSSQPQLCVWRVLLALSLFVVGAVPAAAQTIRISNGNNQSGIVATPLPNPLVVKLQSALGIGLTGVTVTFTVSSGGGSVTPASAVTDANGLASTRLTLGSVSGTNRVVASASGIGSVTFSATAKAGAPARLALTPTNTSTKAGVAVSYSAAIRDSYGNTVTSATNPITFSASAVSGSFNPASPVSPTSGVAKSSFTPTTVGSATITASATGLSSATATLSVTPGTAAKLALTPASASMQAGTGLSYTATVQDASGNTVSTATNAITFSVTGVSGSFSPSATVSAEVV